MRSTFTNNNDYYEYSFTEMRSTFTNSSDYYEYSYMELRSTCTNSTTKLQYLAAIFISRKRNLTQMFAMCTEKIFEGIFKFKTSYL